MFLFRSLAVPWPTAGRQMLFDKMSSNFFQASLLSVKNFFQLLLRKKIAAGIKIEKNCCVDKFIGRRSFRKKCIGEERHILGRDGCWVVGAVSTRLRGQGFCSSDHQFTFHFIYLVSARLDKEWGFRWRQRSRIIASYIFCHPIILLIILMSH